MGWRMDGGFCVRVSCIGWSRVFGEDCYVRCFADSLSHVARAIDRGTEREGVEPKAGVGYFWCT